MTNFALGPRSFMFRLCLKGFNAIDSIFLLLLQIFMLKYRTFLIYLFNGSGFPFGIMRQLVVPNGLCSHIMVIPWYFTAAARCYMILNWILKKIPSYAAALRDVFTRVCSFFISYRTLGHWHLCGISLTITFFRCHLQLQFTLKQNTVVP